VVFATVSEIAASRSPVATHAEPSRLDTGEGGAHCLTERGRVDRLNAVCLARECVRMVEALSGNGVADRVGVAKDEPGVSEF
jgi:hypothetical protein